MAEEKPADLLMCVGDRFYPTAEEFITEAEKFGCSRRIAKYPLKAVVGKSRMFLAHDGGRDCPNCPVGEAKIWRAKHKECAGVGCAGCSEGTVMKPVGGRKPKLVVKKGTKGTMVCEECGTPFPHLLSVFAWFPIDRVELIGEDLKGTIDSSDMDVHVIPKDAVVKEPLRGCGRRKIGALYVVSRPDLMEIARSGKVEETIAHGPITVLRESVAFSSERFRSYKYIDGDSVLGGAPAKEWSVEETEGSKPFTCSHGRKFRSTKRYMGHMRREHTVEESNEAATVLGLPVQSTFDDHPETPVDPAAKAFAAAVVKGAIGGAIMGALGEIAKTLLAKKSESKSVLDYGDEKHE